MSPRAGHAGLPSRTLAFVESPVQLLNVLEWAHLHGLGGAGPDPLPAVPAQVPRTADGERRAAGAGLAELTVVVLSPTDPMTRGQLRRMADLARDEGYRVRWEEARGGPTAPFATIGGLAGSLRGADRVVLGDPFSRYVQMLLTITRAKDLVVVDDGTATLEFVAQLARGERL